MSKVSMSIINKHEDMFMISASSASNEFTGKDDQFFRVHVANNAQRFDSFTKYVKNNDFNKKRITRYVSLFKRSQYSINNEYIRKFLFTA